MANNQLTLQQKDTLFLNDEEIAYAENIKFTHEPFLNHKEGIGLTGYTNKKDYVKGEITFDLPDGSEDEKKVEAFDITSSLVTFVARKIVFTVDEAGNITATTKGPLLGARMAKSGESDDEESRKTSYTISGNYFGSREKL